MALTTGRMLETLSELDLLDLGDPGVWPGEPEGFDVLDIDWSAVQDADPNIGQETEAHPRWREVEFELDRRSRGEFEFPPEEVLDALAWYLPIHYFGPAWGIYIREDAILDLASMILGRLDPWDRGNLQIVQATVQAALTILYLHEAFHHKVESFAVRLEVVERGRRYLRYQRNVYQPLSGSDDQLEEGLACAEMIRRLGEPTYRRGLPDSVRRATVEFLRDWIPRLPPGYRQGVSLAEPESYEAARAQLSSQLQEGRPYTSRNADDWALVPHSYRGFFNWKTIVHVIVPIGTAPIVPWFATPIPGLSVSSRDAERVVRSAGYELVTGGKGSHLKYRAKGRPMVIIPDGRKDLSLRVLKSIAESLNLRSVRQLEIRL
jgi:predicted RNA binding protein YcfA (HicA-like mRNA interferase family)